MTILTWILGVLFILAVIYIIVDYLIARLMRRGNFTIRIEMDDGKD